MTFSNTLNNGTLSRRGFLRGCTTVAASSVMAHPLLGEPLTAAVRAEQVRWGRPGDTAVLADTARMKQLAQHAVDAAKTAGAHYAEAHLTRIVKQITHGIDNVVWMSGQVKDQEFLSVGVRCLVNGRWGFAASPFWTLDDVSRLAHSAVEQARASAINDPGTVLLGTATPVVGDWRMPVQIDPFTVPLEERKDFAQALESWCSGYKITGSYGIAMWVLLPFTRKELVTATSDGTVLSQTLFANLGKLSLRVEKIPEMNLYVDLPFHTPLQSWQGWELMQEYHIKEQIAVLFETGVEILKAGYRPADIGRYQVVFDAYTMGSLLGASLGAATEVDRMLGYEANASGTSYLGSEPLDVLGSAQVAAPTVTITADRSIPGGQATVKWDSEGVAPRDTQLVTDGMLTDLQTTREQATWLTPYYQKVARTTQSNGYAECESALFPSMQLRPNLSLRPAREDLSMPEIIKTVKNGLAVFYGGTRDMDFQGRTGMIVGLVREIVNGKLGKQVTGASFLFESSELWKNIRTIGGASSVVLTDQKQRKGQPRQEASYSVRAVPALATDVALIDPYRRV